MKAAPTLDGRLRIDAETEIDLMVLRAIVTDAVRHGHALADYLAGGMPDELQADWEHFVTADLQQQFDGQLAYVAEELKSLEVGQPLFIDRQQADSWYGALNQARLSLEEKHRFGSASPDELSDESRDAMRRSHFYLAVQNLLLDFLMQ